MAEAAQIETFRDKYQNLEKIWSGTSFSNCGEARNLLAELPVSRVPGPAKDYPHIYVGILDNVFGQLMHTLVTCEGIIKDRHADILECFIRPIFNPDNTILEFNLRYKTTAGEEVTKTYEVIRNGDRSYVFYS
ncbi:MAG: hypothetical protein BZ151_10420 [Desulfobacca sp. 4484_104]|nr:MAG: hypothetical protein BZ151_10420 [Desulfobacca sp. 4484_104]RLA90106.1 MAG: hypothetical protein DRG58_03105 [Deltaproteobacteria bacterium]